MDTAKKKNGHVSKKVKSMIDEHDPTIKMYELQAMQIESQEETKKINNLLLDPDSPFWKNIAALLVGFQEEINNDLDRKFVRLYTYIENLKTKRIARTYFIFFPVDNMEEKLKNNIKLVDQSVSDLKPELALIDNSISNLAQLHLSKDSEPSREFENSRAVISLTRIESENNKDTTENEEETAMKKYFHPFKNHGPVYDLNGASDKRKEQVKSWHQPAGVPLVFSSRQKYDKKNHWFPCNYIDNTENSIETKMKLNFYKSTAVEMYNASSVKWVIFFGGIIYDIRYLVNVNFPLYQRLCDDSKQQSFSEEELDQISKNFVGELKRDE